MKSLICLCYCGIILSMVTAYPQQQTEQSTTQQTIEVTTRSTRYLNCFHNCPTTPEFNPYCGSDNNVYDNRQKIDCANNCGQLHEPNWTCILLSLISLAISQQPTMMQSTSQQAPIIPAVAVSEQLNYVHCYHNCITTSEYNPYCGSDNNVYDNLQKFGCANNCGRRHQSNWIDVTPVRRGRC